MGAEIPVIVRRNVEYGKVGSRPLLMDLYTPQEVSSDRMPVIVWIHGGGWEGGNRLDYASAAIPYAEEGYFCASVGYRLTVEAAFPAQIHDCKCAIRYLRAHADEYGIDPDRIGVRGASAGGHLAALLGTSGGVRELEGTSEWGEYSSRVQAVVDDFGPADLLTIFDELAAAKPESRNDFWKWTVGIYEKLMGGPLAENREKAALASPVTYLSNNDPPFLIVHGTADDLVLYNQSVILDQALRKAGVESELVTIKNGGHGSWHFWQPDIMEKPRNFFSRHLRGKEAR